MWIKMPLSTLWSASSNHNCNAALHIYGPPAMFSNDLRLPAMPASVARETNRETLEHLGSFPQLTLIVCLVMTNWIALFGDMEWRRLEWTTLGRFLFWCGVTRKLLLKKLCDGWHCRSFTRGSRLCCSTKLQIQSCLYCTEEALLEILKVCKY